MDEIIGLIYKHAVDSLEYTKDKDSKENFIRTLETYKTLERIKQNIDKINVSDILELIKYKEVNNSLFDTQRLQELRKHAMEKDEIESFKAFYRNINESNITD